MGKLNTNQQGFSVIEDILVLLALALVCFTGWYVYSTNKSTNATYAVASQTSSSFAKFSSQGKKTTQNPSTKDSAQTTTTVQIPGLGIEITVPNSIKDLIYHVLTGTAKNGTQGIAAVFSTATLAAADANCGTSFGPLGSLSKVTGQYPSDANSGGTALYGTLVKQYPTYYVSVTYPNGGACSKDDSVQAMVISDASAFSQSLSTIQPLN